MGQGMSTPSITITERTLAVLRVLVEHADVDDLYGLKISRDSGLSLATGSYVLHHLEIHGVVESRWEHGSPTVLRRPRRRYRRLTPAGLVIARRALLADAEKWR